MAGDRKIAGLVQMLQADLLEAGAFAVAAQAGGEPGDTTGRVSSLSS